MKVCPECGTDNSETRDFCQVCGRNLKSDIVKSDNKPAITNQLLYKVDKKTGILRVSKAKSFSVLSFSIIFLFSLFVGVYSPLSIGPFIVVGILFGLLVGLVVYLIGYIIGAIIDKFDL